MTMRDNVDYIRVLLYVKVTLRDHGKENGSCYSGFRVYRVYRV